MATAHVAGVAAMLMSHFPVCTNNQIRNAMIRSTTEAPTTDLRRNRFGWDQHYGWGIVNAGKAYELLDKGCVFAGGAYDIATTLSDQAFGGKTKYVLG
jgi:serine protease